MIRSDCPPHDRLPLPGPARQALWLWLVFFCAAVVLNGTVPFVAGADLRAWTDSRTKDALFGLVIYGGLFMVVPPGRRDRQPAPLR